jgi:hypothetical protein
LTEWPSLYHFRITSSESTSAVTNTTVNSQVFCEMTPWWMAGSYCFGGVCCRNSRVLEWTDSDNEGRVGCVLVHFGCDVEEYMHSASCCHFPHRPKMWHKANIYSWKTG